MNSTHEHELPANCKPIPSMLMKGQVMGLKPIATFSISREMAKVGYKYPPHAIKKGIGKKRR